jgi:hypothetical protein
MQTETVPQSAPKYQNDYFWYEIIYKILPLFYFVIELENY